jgi:hypothetical protein
MQFSDDSYFNAFLTATNREDFTEKQADGLRYAPSGYAGAGVDSAWEQEKLEVWKMLENAAESHTSGARIVRLNNNISKPCSLIY